MSMSEIKGRLFLVPTPIGNLGDVTRRSVDCLNCCDVVYCEDTRVTGKLLNALSITKPLVRMDENSINEHVQKIIDDCEDGKAVCYCSDAGMPGISDPGSRIVEACRDEGVPVEVLPGANACLTAIVASGFKADHFFFEGFLPKKKNQKENRLQNLLDLTCPFVIYESPKRMSDTIELIARLAPERIVCVAKELTKLHEEIIINTAKDVLESLSDFVLKGEFVIVVDGVSEKESRDKKSRDLVQAHLFAEKQVDRGISAGEVRSDLVQFFGISKNDAYEISLETNKK